MQNYARFLALHLSKYNLTICSPTKKNIVFSLAGPKNLFKFPFPLFLKEKFTIYPGLYQNEI